MFRLRRRAATALLAGALAWAAVGFASEARRAAVAARAGRSSAVAAQDWRTQSPEVIALDQFLARAARRLPSGARVAFVVGPDRPIAHLQSFRWALFLRPDLPLFEAATCDWRRATHCITYREPRAPAGGRTVLRRGRLALIARR